MDDVYVRMNDLNFIWTLYCVCDELYVIMIDYVIVNGLCGCECDSGNLEKWLISTACEKPPKIKLYYFRQLFSGRRILATVIFDDFLIFGCERKADENKKILISSGFLVA
jgi:hypothetical protein